MRRAVLFVAMTAAGLLAPACRKQEDSPPHEASAEHPVWFEEVAKQVGLDVTHDSGQSDRYWFPASTAGGVCLFDYDNDGWLDVYFVQGGPLGSEDTARPRNRLFRNTAQGQFEDVTDKAGVGDDSYGQGCACADYDNDGDVDLYVTNLGPNVLYRNNGDGTFTDVTRSTGVGDPSWGCSCLFADYDNDGWLDLFVVNYITWSPETEVECTARGGQPDFCSPKNYDAPARDTLYHNNGNGTFADVSTDVGLDKAYGNGLGIACADFNNDGRLDFYVANDQVPNQMWIQGGSDNRTVFQDEALMAGCAVNQYGVAEAGMGVTAIDLGNDGDADLFMVHLREETNTFYENVDGQFRDVTASIGLAAPSLGYTGFGTGFADFDRDGYLDLYVANGRVNRGGKLHDPNDPYAEPNLLLRGIDDTHFEEVMPQGGTRELLIASSRAAAFGDIDNDGDIDIVVANKDGPLHLLRNIVAKRGNWVMLRIIDRNGRDAVGATVGVDAGGRRQYRIVQPGYSFCASNDPRPHFGLGTAERVDSVSVRWPDGEQDTFGPFTASAIHTIRRGDAPTSHKNTTP